MLKYQITILSMVDEMLDDYLSREDKGVEWLKDYAQFFNVDHKI